MINRLTIKKHLKSYGYNLNYSYDDYLMGKDLKKHLGGKKFNEFWNYVDNMRDQFGDEEIEEIIQDYIGDDIKHHKILLSGQIGISVEILNQIIHSINADCENKSTSVLELGGFDGWASDYLNKSLEFETNITTVDKEGGFNQKNENVLLIKSDYKDFSSTEKYGIIFSILGSPYKKIDSLINCIGRNIKKGGSVYISARIQPSEYDEFILKMENKGFKNSENSPEIIKVKLATNTQYFPLYKMSYS